MKNRITFLGTGTSTGVPVLTCECEVCVSPDSHDKRLRSSVFVEYNDARFIIDCGPDFRQQLLTNRITDFDAILITHGHRDHIAGIDEVRAFNYIRNKTVEMYAAEYTLMPIMTEFPYIFNPGEYKGAPKINIHTIQNSSFLIGENEITPLPALHGDAPVLGFRFGKLAYLTDASSIPESTYALLENLDVLVLNALRKKKHATHFSLDEAMAVATRVGAKQTYFTHISHFLGLHQAVTNDLPNGMYLASDGLKVEFE